MSELDKNLVDIQKDDMIEDAEERALLVVCKDMISTSSVNYKTSVVQHGEEAEIKKYNSAAKSGSYKYLVLEPK